MPEFGNPYKEDPRPGPDQPAAGQSPPLTEQGWARYGGLAAMYVRHRLEVPARIATVARIKAVLAGAEALVDMLREITKSEK